jgi:hypothetical protein
MTFTSFLLAFAMSTTASPVAVPSITAPSDTLRGRVEDTTGAPLAS